MSRYRELEFIVGHMLALDWRGDAVYFCILAARLMRCTVSERHTTPPRVASTGHTHPWWSPTTRLFPRGFPSWLGHRAHGKGILVQGLPGLGVVPGRGLGRRRPDIGRRVVLLPLRHSIQMLSCGSYKTRSGSKDHAILAAPVPSDGLSRRRVRAAPGRDPIAHRRPAGTTSPSTTT